MKLGTYSTIDCPTKNIGEAYCWLQTEFDNIGGTVRKVSNPHDMGYYPSFEIDYPDSILEASDYVDMNEFEDNIDQEEFDKQQSLVDNWTDAANKIEAEYSKKFAEFL